jgi:Zn-dependent peptidase ImmA (M78 family)
MIRAFANEFVLECEEIALERRGELDIAEWEPIDPRRVAEELLAIDVIAVDHYRASYPDEVGQLTERDAVSFNAMTVFHGTRCLIVVNPSQGSADEALSVAHEIAHIELEHERLEAPLFDDDGTRRSWRPTDEEEAEYLAREILVPRRGLRTVLTQFGGVRRQAARYFGVSPALIRQRMIETETGSGGRARIEMPASGNMDFTAERSGSVPPQTRPRP